MAPRPPRKVDFKVVPLEIPVELYSLLKSYAKNNGVYMRNVISVAFLFYLKHVGRDFLEYMNEQLNA